MKKDFVIFTFDSKEQKETFIKELKEEKLSVENKAIIEALYRLTLKGV